MRYVGATLTSVAMAAAGGRRTAFAASAADVTADARRSWHPGRARCCARRPVSAPAPDQDICRNGQPWTLANEHDEARGPCCNLVLADYDQPPHYSRRVHPCGGNSRRASFWTRLDDRSVTTIGLAVKAARAEHTHPIAKLDRCRRRI